MASTVEVLRAAPFFRDLEEKDRNALAAIGRICLFQKGDPVFHEGEDATQLYMVLRGTIKIFKTTPTGKDITLALLGPGSPAGAVAVFQEVPFPASAVAFEDAALISVRAPDFFQLLSKEPGFVRRLLGAMTRRLLELNQRFPELAGGNVEARFARFFLKLSRDIGRPVEGGTSIPLRLSRQELSDFTGTTIETAIRVMSRWSKDLLVTTRDDGFVLHDAAALERIASR